MYLIYPDYKLQIQNAQLAQIITNDTTVLTRGELAAEAEVKSYLVQKYEVGQELTNTQKWSYTATYKAHDRIYLDADAYNTSASYTANSLTLYTGKVYKCNANTTGAFDPSKWDLIGDQYTIYYVQYPKPVFDLYGNYVTGNQVFWNNKTYTCLSSSYIADSLQYGTYDNVPLRNQFPDQPGQMQWGAGVNYGVPANTLLSNTAYWTAGDNRNQQILLYTIDICLFHLHSRIAPNNIPQLRQNRYDSAIDWLKMAAMGEITAELPKIQPKQGNRIRFGGNVKNTNSY